MAVAVELPSVAELSPHEVSSRAHAMATTIEGVFSHPQWSVPDMTPKVPGAVEAVIRERGNKKNNIRWEILDTGRDSFAERNITVRKRTVRKSTPLSVVSNEGDGHNVETLSEEIETVSLNFPDVSAGGSPTIQYSTNLENGSSRSALEGIIQAEKLVDQLGGLTGESWGGTVTMVEDSRRKPVYPEKPSQTVGRLSGLVESGRAESAQRLLRETPRGRLTVPEIIQLRIAEIDIRQAELQEALPPEVYAVVTKWDEQAKSVDSLKKGPIELGPQAMELWKLQRRSRSLKINALGHERERLLWHRHTTGDGMKAIRAGVAMRNTEHSLEKLADQLVPVEIYPKEETPPKKGALVLTN